MDKESRALSPILPSGTVTFLFTDIEGSTQLLNRLRDQYAALLADHHKIIRGALDRWNGREVDTQGDAFFAAFPKATDAVAAVAEIQRGLDEHSWPEGVQIRVRMGLHTGEPWLIEEGYTGMDVHRAARIGHAGHGGQVLLSETTTALVRDELPEGMALQDLGRHRFKDMRRPESIHQLALEGLPAEFPPLKSLETLLAVQPDLVVKTAGAPRKVGSSPYRGLAVFRESDAGHFFGREAFTTRLLNAVGERQIVAVIVGASGSGKSSAVFAGLLPQLREQGKWLIIETRPGGRPFYALAGALIPHLEEEPSETGNLIETKRLAQALRDGELSLFQVVDRVLARHLEAQRLILVIDQFEELFTHRSDTEIQHLFMDELLAAAEAGATQRRSPLVLLLTLRADFMGQALTHRHFADALQEGSLILGPMNREELQAAVEKPAELQGAAFEAGLVQRILDDVGDEPGNLPLLEFALTLLWERLANGWMTHAAYDEIGRVDGALARYAEEVWADLDEAERDGARILFVQLVQPGEGTEDTRRVARRADLVPGYWSLVQHLADRRLVVSGQDGAGGETVELVHEALIRGWDRLRTWMTEDRTFRTWQEGLRVAQRGWEAGGRDEGALLRGAPLALALEWAEGGGVALGPLEKEFIEASRLERERRQVAEETRRRRELETAERLAETEHARAEEQALAARGLRRRAYILGGVFILAVVLAIAAFFFAQQSVQNANIAATREAEALAEADERATAQAEANEQRNAALVAREEAQANAALAEAAANAEATAAAQARDQQAIAEQEREIALEQAALARSRELAVMAAGNLEVDPELSMLLALESVSKAQTNEAVSALHRATMASRLRERYTIHDEETPITTVVFSPDGVYASSAAGSPDSTARIWEVANGQELFKLPVGSGAVENYAQVTFNSDGSRVAILNPGNDFVLSFWAVPFGEALGTVSLPLSTEILTGYALNPDWTQVAVGFDDGRASVWEIPISLGEGEATGQQLYDLPGHNDGRIRLDYSRNGERLVTTSTGEENMIVWNTSTGRELVRLNMTDLGAREVTDPAALSPDGRYLAALSTGDVLVVWDLENTEGGPLSTMERHLNLIEGIAFNADGTAVATTSLDQIARVWDPFSGQERFTLYHNKDLAAVAFSEDGNQLLTADGHGGVQIWDLTPNGQSELMSFEAGGIDVYDPIVSPDGSRLAVAYNTVISGATIKVWDLSTGELLVATDLLDRSVWQMAYSPDGERLASAGEDGMVRIWDANSGEELLTLAGHGEGLFSCCFTGVMDVAFSPDGSRLASAGVDKTARIWDAQTGQELLVLSGNSNGLGKVAFSPDGTRLVTASDLPEVKLWDAETGRELFTLPAEHTGAIWWVSFSPDGTKLVTAGRDRTIRLWDLDFTAATGHLLASLTGHKNTLFKVEYGPQRQLLVSNDFGCAELKLWDLSGFPETLPEEMISLPGSCDFAFPPDGNTLIVAFDDGSMRVITLDVDELVTIAKSRLTRNFTTEECAKYLIDPCPAN